MFLAVKTKNETDEFYSYKGNFCHTIRLIGIRDFRLNRNPCGIIPDGLMSPDQVTDLYSHNWDSNLGHHFKILKRNARFVKVELKNVKQTV